MYRKIFVLVVFVSLGACTKRKESLTVQEIIDKAIEVSGGQLYDSSTVSFVFRDKRYVASQENGSKVYERQTIVDSITITDKLSSSGFERYFNDSLVAVSDSLARRYSNSVNSVHYFVRLPYGLNDAAVNKTLLGSAKIGKRDYYKIRVTFDEVGGGDDFDDEYLYWIDKKTFKPDYLAYKFHVNGGGIRFREAYNERYVNGIRIVDYNNYKADAPAVRLEKIDSLFEAGALELLSKIEMQDVAAIR